MLAKIKRFLRNNKLTRDLYQSLGKIKSRKRINEIKNTIKQNGVKTVLEIQRLLENYNTKFYFDMGTLLGIVREGGFIGHDLDIDVAVYIEASKVEAFVEYLTSNNAIHKFRYKVEGLGIIEDSFLLNDIKFDINYYTVEEDKAICYLSYLDPQKLEITDDLNTVKLTCTKIEEIIKTEFLGINVNVPMHAEQYLSERYGMNWRVPDKKYVYWRGPSATQIPNISKKIVINE